MVTSFSSGQGSNPLPGGFDTRDFEWFLECHGKTLKDFVEWVGTK